MTDPDQRVYFLLQRAAHRARIYADRRCLAVAGVTTAQLGALFVVAGSDGVTQQDLARELGLREPAVATLVGRLAAANLIDKAAHPHEHRAVVITLTDRGATTLQAARPEIASFNAELADLLGQSALAQFATALTQLATWHS